MFSVWCIMKRVLVSSGARQDDINAAEAIKIGKRAMGELDILSLQNGTYHFGGPRYDD